MISFWDIFFILLNMEFSCNVLETMLKLLAVCFLEWINYLNEVTKFIYGWSYRKSMEIKLAFPITCDRILWERLSKGSLKACTAFPFSARPVISSYKIIELFKHDMPLVNPWWLFLIFLLLMSLKMISRISWSSTFLGTEVRLVTSVPWVLLLAPPEDSCDFCFFLVFWYISYFNGLLRVVMPSATSVSTQKCIPPSLYACLYPVFLSVPWSDPLPSKVHLTCFRFSLWPLLYSEFHFYTLIQKS